MQSVAVIMAAELSCHGHGLKLSNSPSFDSLCLLLSLILLSCLSRLVYSHLTRQLSRTLPLVLHFFNSSPCIDK
jgi:hypothetical protein